MNKGTLKGNVRVKKIWHFWRTDKPFMRPEKISATSCPYCEQLCEVTEERRTVRACGHFLYIKDGYAFFK